MRTRNLFTGAFVAIALLIAGCSQESSGPAQPEPTAAPAPEPAMPAPAPMSQGDVDEPASAPEPEAVAALSEPATAAAPAPAPAPAAITQPAVTAPAKPTAPAAPPPPPAAQPLAAAPAAITAATAPAPVPAPVPKPAAPESVPAATADIVDPGGIVEVAATKPGLTRIGSEECGDCHDVQYASWAEGPHATRKPPLDCEGCHGPGSEYKPKAIMKDPDKARAAGLVMPDKAFCGKCHKRGVNDDLMKNVHAHEE